MGDFSSKKTLFLPFHSALEISWEKSDKSKVKRKNWIYRKYTNKSLTHHWPKYCFVLFCFVSLSLCLLNLQQFNLEETPWAEMPVQVDHWCTVTQNLVWCYLQRVVGTRLPRAERCGCECIRQAAVLSESCVPNTSLEAQCSCNKRGNKRPLINSEELPSIRRNKVKRKENKIPSENTWWKCRDFLGFLKAR